MVNVRYWRKADIGRLTASNLQWSFGSRDLTTVPRSDGLFVSPRTWFAGGALCISGIVDHLSA